MENLSINIGGRLMDFNLPRVMGIINVTPDSFYAGSRVQASQDIAGRAAAMLAAGADILDLGAYSTRPGAAEVGADEEFLRLARALEAIRADFPDAVISVDTFRAGVARRCVVEFGADIINDVGGGTLDPEMFATVADLKVPYILMHMRGTPATMQSMTDYADVTAEVIRDLAFKADRLHQMGVCDVIIDPGFGFAKTVEQNFQLLANLAEFRQLGMPILVGISRKTMIWRSLGITADEALNGTTVINTLALASGGADILRVHDVRAAVEAVRLVTLMRSASKARNHDCHD